jgi:P-type Cu+ transporter
LMRMRRRWVLSGRRSARELAMQRRVLCVSTTAEHGAKLEIADSLASHVRDNIARNGDDDDSAVADFSVISSADPLISGVYDPSTALARTAADYRRMFFISLVFTAPIVVLAMILPNVGVSALDTRVGSSAIAVKDLVSWILATPVQFYCGYRFYRGTWFALKSLRANMDTLISVGTSVAYFFSVAILAMSSIQLSRGSEMTKEMVVFETSSLLITIVLLGKWMETLAKARAAGSVAALAELQPTTADVVSAPPTCQMRCTVDVNLVSVGDYVRVNAGAAFPVDSVVVRGDTVVDESMLTGEAMPVSKRVGDDVFSGTINGAGSVVVRCSAVGEDTMLSSIVRLVQNAQAAKAPIEHYADRVSAVFVPAVIAISVLTTVVWFALAQTGAVPESWRSAKEGNVIFALLFGMSVLVISCPCALGIATPTVVMVVTGMAARKLGILFKGGGDALQAASNINTVLFDKVCLG